MAFTLAWWFGVNPNIYSTIAIVNKFKAQQIESRQIRILGCKSSEYLTKPK